MATVFFFLITQTPGIEQNPQQLCVFLLLFCVCKKTKWFKMPLEILAAVKRKKVDKRLKKHYFLNSPWSSKHPFPSPHSSSTITEWKTVSVWLLQMGKKLSRAHKGVNMPPETAAGRRRPTSSSRNEWGRQRRFGDSSRIFSQTSIFSLSLPHWPSHEVPCLSFRWKCPDLAHNLVWVLTAYTQPPSQHPPPSGLSMPSCLYRFPLFGRRGLGQTCGWVCLWGWVLDKASFVLQSGGAEYHSLLNLQDISSIKVILLERDRHGWCLSKWGVCMFMWCGRGKTGQSRKHTGG